MFLYHTLAKRKTIETAADGILFMMCVKLSREANAHNVDNIVDLAGYADLYNYARTERKGNAIAEGKQKNVDDAKGRAESTGLGYNMPSFTV